MSSITVNSTTSTPVSTTPVETLGGAKPAETKGGAGTDTVPAAKALGSETQETPALPQPRTLNSSIDFKSLTAVESFGAQVLALMVETAEEQRRANTECRVNAALATAESIRSQADALESQAAASLALNMTGALISIGANAMKAASSAANIKPTADIGSDDLHAATLTALNTKTTGISGAVEGLSNLVSAVEGFTSKSTDADVKRIDAEIEEQRALRTQLDSLDESLKELIARARDAMENIQQSTNQARTRILG